MNRIRTFIREHPRALILGAVVLIALPFAWSRVDFSRLHDWAEHVNPPLLFAALVILPLFTVPVTPLNVLAGVRFGIGGGLAFVAGAIVCQHLLAYFTARLLPVCLHRRLDPLRERLPEHAHTDATIFTALLPGAPYWAQLYVLPLIGVPLTTLLTLSAAVHTVRSITAIMVGQLSDHLTVGWTIALVVYGTLLAVACLLAGRRMARKYQPHAASSTA